MTTEEMQVALNKLDTKLDTIVDKDGNVKKTALRWLVSQESSAVALWVIFAVMGYSAYYLVTTGIPNHLQQIHKGYCEISEENNRIHKEIADQTVKEAQAQREHFEKALDRFEKTFEAGVRAALERNTNAVRENTSAQKEKLP